MHRKHYILISVILILIVTSFIEYTYIITHQTHKVKFKTQKDTIALSLEQFLYKMGEMESGNDYTKINTFGYIGKYQFGKSALITLGYDSITTQEFINSPELQEKIMLENLLFNKRVLQSYIDKYEGECVNNIPITESGLLAAAHLSGASSVKRFIDNQYDPSDSYGTKLSDYLIQFYNYKLNLN